MEWFIPIELAQMIMSFLYTILFFFLYWHDKKVYLLYWGLSVAAWSLKYIVEIIVYLDGYSIIYQIVDLICWLLGNIFLSYGVLSLIHKKVPHWVAIGRYFSGIWIFTSVILGLPIIYQQVVIFLFGGILFSWTGVQLLTKMKAKIIAKYITGLSLIILGFHFADFPFIGDKEWLAPIGYLLAMILVFFTINGNLIIYHQIIKQDLLESEERFRLLTENALDIIYKYRLYPKIEPEYISPVVEKITGYSPKDFYDNPDLYLTIVHPDDQVIMGEFLNNTDRKQNMITVRWVKKDGQVIWIEQKNRPICNKIGELISLEGIVRDITDRKQSEENVIRIDQSRRRLMSNISHELKTPMTSIQGYLEALMDQVIKKEEDRRKYLQLIHHRVMGVNRIIEDLFDLSNIESRQISFNFQAISVNYLLKQIYVRFHLEFKNQGIELIVDSNEFDRDHSKTNKVTHVFVDMDRINQVFLNLFSNAMKHTQAGGKVIVKPSLNDEKDEIVISIRDTGTGIEEKDLPYIFDRFYKAVHTKGSHNGSGLGLAITKEIIIAHKGIIWVESELKKGTTFFFTLPTYNKK